jgi:Flp pilus assembly protein TadG
MVELAVAMPVLVLLLLAAADFGRLFYAWIGVNNAARAGAQYGSQGLANAGNSAAMILAATTDGANISGLTATASQCTCVSGTSVTVCSGSNYNCTNAPQATFVEVDTQTTFHTVISYPGIPSSITVKGQAIMQVSG